MLFDVTIKDSLNYVHTILDIILNITEEGEQFHVVLVGNKIDLNKNILKRDINMVLESFSIADYVECSARTKKNILNIFKDLIENSYMSKMKKDSTKKRNSNKSRNSCRLTKQRRRSNIESSDIESKDLIERRASFTATGKESTVKSLKASMQALFRQKSKKRCEDIATRPEVSKHKSHAAGQRQEQV